MTFGARYAEALSAHVAAGTEDTLVTAYVLARNALAEGEALLDLATAHHDALKTLRTDATSIDRAAQFFAEALAPFEMAWQGYRAANAELQRLNLDLGTRNAELARAKEAAEAAGRELGAFSDAVSHDLRAPLRSIDGFSRALKTDHGPALGPDGNAQLDRVLAAARRMEQLIADLLALSRVSRSELKLEPVDVSQLARAVAATLAATQAARTIDLAIAPDLSVLADPGLLRIALENLLGNAWKFTSKKPSARIELGAVPGGFFVRDDGAGFDMGLHRRLFGAFQRLHAASEFEGSGIGLATVQRIVSRHGGTLTGEGAVGQGATFTLTFPAPR